MSAPPPELAAQLRERLLFLRESGVQHLAARPKKPHMPGLSHRPCPDPVSGPLGAVSDPEAALAELRVEIGDCRRCRLREKRSHLVF